MDRAAETHGASGWRLVLEPGEPERIVATDGEVIWQSEWTAAED